MEILGRPQLATDAALLRLLDRYERSGRAITVNFRRLVPDLANAERATHLIHPYPAKLLMHIPAFFLRNSLLSSPGDTVFDPFCGSGTVPLESQLAGRFALGCDTNPLAALIAQVKTRPLPTDHLKRRAEALFQRIPDTPRREPPDVVNLDHWFYPHVISQLTRILDAVDRTRDDRIRDFLRVCLSNCVRKVSLANPRLSVPVRLRAGQYPEGNPFREKLDQHLRSLRGVNVETVFRYVVDVNLKRLHLLSNLHLPESCIFQGNARQLRAPLDGNGDSRYIVDSESVQLIITSPPYPGAQKYIRSSSLSLGWLGMCHGSGLRRLKAETIGREEFHSCDCERVPVTGVPSADRILVRIHQCDCVRAAIAGTYLNEMREALREMHRVLVPGGYLVLVAANNRIAGQTFRTQDYLRRIAQAEGFLLLARMIDAIRSRGLMTKRNDTASVITREWVMLFRKRNLNGRLAR
jgi:DNA modification methylase